MAHPPAPTPRFRPGIGPIMYSLILGCLCCNLMAAHAGLGAPRPGRLPPSPQQGGGATQILAGVDTKEAEAERLFQKSFEQIQQDQLPAAIGTLQQADQLFQALGNLPRRTKIQITLALLYRELKDSAKAKEAAQAALTLARTAQIPDLEAIAQTLVSSLQGQGDRQAQANTLLDQGRLLFNQSQYGFALQRFEQAQEIYQELQDRQGEQQVLLQIGAVYSSLGNYDRAIALYQKSLTLAQSINNRYAQAQILANIGIAHGAQAQLFGNIDSGKTVQAHNQTAIEFLEKAVALLRELQDFKGEAKALANLSLVYQAVQDYDRAAIVLEQSLKLARQQSDQKIEADALINLGVLFRLQSNYPQSLEYLQQSLGLFRQLKDRLGEAVALDNLGIVFYLLKQYEPAKVNLEQSLLVLESLRNNLTDAQKVSIFEAQKKAYLSLQRVLMALKQPEQALEVAERSRARAFVELLAERFGSLPNQPSGNTSGSMTPRASLTLPPPTLAQIRQIAKDQNATLVEYANIDGEKLLIWVIQPTGEFHGVEVDLRRLQLPLDGMISAARCFDDTDCTQRTISANRGAFEFNTALSNQLAQQEISRWNLNYYLQELHKVLIQPIAAYLPKDPEAHVIFIPQDELFLVPFPALQDQTGQYLVQHHTILTAPSIQVLALTHQQRLQRPQTSSSGPVLVVGNPTMPTLPGTEGRPVQLVSLPGAGDEALAIATLLKTEALIGPQATKAKVIDRMRQARIIHLATHGLLADIDGLGTPGAIALAPDADFRPSSGQVNGILTASEILDLSLAADLVVLSACDTGKGRITGDGVIGLSRSLIAAGASSVIVSLWKVPDDATAALMTSFYRNLQTNPDKAQALRQAMLTTLKQYPEVPSWAAFTLIGEAL